MEDEIRNGLIEKTVLMFLKKCNPKDKCIDPMSKCVIRNALYQYVPTEKKCHVSAAATKKWENLTSEKICNYSYQKVFRADKLKSKIKIKIFKGNNDTKGQNKTIEPNESIKFKYLFTDEHMIPLGVIIDDLEKLVKNKNVNLTSVKKVLSKIHICKITKEEDATLIENGLMRKRPNNYKSVKNNVYKPLGIEIKK